VACSFGKDSVLVLYLVREQYPDIAVVHCNTGVEFLETLSFKEQMVNQWSLNYHEAKPNTTYGKIVSKYGLPGIRLKDGEREPKCCYYLKNLPGRLMYESLGTKCIFTGITASESRNRFFLSKRCGDYYQHKDPKELGRWKCHPIMDYTESDVWDAHSILGISHNPFYDRCPGDRVGCAPCTAYIGWFRKMPYQSPKWFNWVRKKVGQKSLNDY
jgi:phosphoadenosine phosphosulfate reductase